MNAAEREMMKAVVLTPAQEQNDEHSTNVQEIRKELAKLPAGDERRVLLQTELDKILARAPEVARSVGGPGRASFDPRRTDYSELMAAATTPAGTSSSMTVRSKMNPVTFEDAKVQTEQYIKANTALNDMLKATLGDSRSTAGDLVKAVGNAGEAAAEAIKAKGAEEITAAQKSIDTVAFFGATQNPDSQFALAQMKREQAIQTMDALRPRIQEEANVTIFDDPLRWLVNRFSLPQLIGTYNAANQTLNQKTKEVATTQQLVAAQKAIDPGVSVEQAKQRITAEANVKLMDTLKQQAIVRNETTVHMAQNIMQQAQLLSANQNAYTGLIRLYGEHLSITEASKQDQGLLPIIDAVNVQRKSLGLPELTMAQFKSMNAAERSELSKRSALPPGVYGTDPGDSLRFIYTSGALSTIPAANPMLAKTLGDVLQSPDFQTHLAAMKMNQGGLYPKFAGLSQEEQYAEALTSFTNKQLNEMKKTRAMDRLTDDNPYKVKFGTALQYKEVQANPLVEDIKILLQNKGYQQDVTPKELELTVLGKAMADPGKIPELARNLSNFYQAAQLKQWATTGAAALNYPRPKEYTTSTMTANGKPVNQWNPAEVEHWLMTRVAREKASSYIMRSPEESAATGTSFQTHLPN